MSCPFSRHIDTYRQLLAPSSSLTNEEVISFVAKRIATKKLSEITEEIIDKILPKVMPPSGIKGKDNMTIVIIKFKGKRAPSEGSMANVPRTSTRRAAGSGSKNSVSK